MMPSTFDYFERWYQVRQVNARLQHDTQRLVLRLQEQDQDLAIDDAAKACKFLGASEEKIFIMSDSVSPSSNSIVSCFYLKNYLN